MPSGGARGSRARAKEHTQRILTQKAHEKAMNRGRLKRERSAAFLCEVKLQNSLPEPPFDAKLLTHGSTFDPRASLWQFSRYQMSCVGGSMTGKAVA